MTTQQFVALLSLIAGAIQGGKVAVSEVIDFFESKGADAQQIAANRALLTADIADVSAQLTADGQS